MLKGCTRTSAENNGQMSHIQHTIDTILYPIHIFVGGDVTNSGIASMLLVALVYSILFDMILGIYNKCRVLVSLISIFLYRKISVGVFSLSAIFRDTLQSGILSTNFPLEYGYRKYMRSKFN